MRNAKLTSEEILEAEKAADDRRMSRNQGFAKMHERDRGYMTLSNGVTMLWHVPKELNKSEGHITLKSGERVKITTYPDPVPEDSFMLMIDGKKHVFDLHEFRKSLRWA